MPNASIKSGLLEKLQQCWPPACWSDHRQLIAVSGGADSVALLRALDHLSPHPQRLIVAHFNHGWRGEESDRDESFVRELCRTMDRELWVGRATSEPSAAATVRTEESARQIRYEYLTRTAYQTGCRYVLTAHTASDRIETMLHHLFRGTGLAGVCKPTLLRPLAEELVLVRPLLSCFRHDTQAYLAGINQVFCEDSSNADQAYRRNFLRQSLLPSVRQVYGSSVDDRLLSFSQTVEETVETLDQLAKQYWQRVAELPGAVAPIESRRGEVASSLRFPSSKILSEHWPVVQQALMAEWMSLGWPRKGLNRGHWEYIYQFWNQRSSASSQGGQSGFFHAPERQSMSAAHGMAPKNISGGICLRLDRDWVILERMG
jgi:tRNA(Ile)-lysidine synthase